MIPLAEQRPEFLGTQIEITSDHRGLEVSDVELLDLHAHSVGRLEALGTFCDELVVEALDDIVGEDAGFQLKR